MAVVAITDVYAPTLRLAQAFSAAGHDVVRVQSSRQIPRVYQPGLPPEDLADTFVANINCDDPVSALAPYNPDAVVAGGECGVELADMLSERLGVPTNGTAHSHTRRSKFDQVELARKSGLGAARQILVQNSDHLRAWHSDIGGKIVIKPLRSAGNDGVHFCTTPAESVAAYEAIKDVENIFSVRNEGVVAQEFLVGTEYVVNTVSCNGTHRITDVWRYTKISVNGVSDRVSAAVSVGPHSSAWPTLEKYALAMLDAIEISYGPVHFEIMLTDDGASLVELGARLSGADTAYYATLATGSSQIDWTVLAYTDPDGFARQCAQPLKLQQHVAMCFLTSPQTGTLKSYPLLDEVKRLESHHNIVPIVAPGGHLHVTVSDTTEPMMVGLANATESALERDLLTLHYLDGRGFYELEAAHG
ncbi:ATP-grasp domain-containing protein [Hoyosella rhizosphaerae]|uniref:ATP-grasp domain-containing protein n=1 Tax=Hoyosella rhizosphaerae TaxID=1755582 RepID=A0A916U0X8_9ACTN|nr:ATP-grasp domain-containing protein [Hoyosella rhizosphaerae]MBN4926944.1 ATP-grasp domain-containing protein [Hoyosella rhizosphaerae]GGC55297.1 ATP-grasp domain-containing protein [Hoyosella rhizosphaerae]